LNIIFIFKDERKSVATDNRWTGRILSYPGPGQYNTKSVFNSSLEHSSIKDNPVYETSAGHGHMANFKSTTNRVFPLSNSEKEIAATPGPSTYNIPSTIKVSHKPAKLQYFSSTETRFKNVRIQALYMPFNLYPILQIYPFLLSTCGFRTYRALYGYTPPPETTM